MYKKSLALWVGWFLFLVILGLIFLAFRVSGLGADDLMFLDKKYTLRADFDSIGNLKVRSSVRLAGVVVGQVDKITLNKDTYQAAVSMQMDSQIDNIPLDSSVSITSMGLLGDNFDCIAPGYSHKYMQDGGQFAVAYSATSLTNLLSTFMSAGKIKHKSGKT